MTVVRLANKGQLAMLEAMADPEPEDKGGRGKTSAKFAGVSKASYLGMARTVLRDSREIAGQVIDGTLALYKAFEALDRSGASFVPGRFYLAKTTCPKGHPYAGSNLYINPRGHRECRACRAARVAAFYRNRESTYSMQSTAE